MDDFTELALILVPLALLASYNLIRRLLFGRRPNLAGLPGALSMRRLKDDGDWRDWYEGSIAGVAVRLAFRRPEVTIDGEAMYESLSVLVPLDGGPSFKFTIARDRKAELVGLGIIAPPLFDDGELNRNLMIESPHGSSAVEPFHDERVCAALKAVLRPPFTSLSSDGNALELYAPWLGVQQHPVDLAGDVKRLIVPLARIALAVSRTKAVPRASGLGLRLAAEALLLGAALFAGWRFYGPAGAVTIGLPLLCYLGAVRRLHDRWLDRSARPVFAELYSLAAPALFTALVLLAMFTV